CVPIGDQANVRSASERNQNANRTAHTGEGVRPMKQHAPFWHEKTVFITGASSGIGEALAVELARLGARVGLFARRAERLERLARRIGSEGGWALSLPGDVAGREEVHRAVERLTRASGPVDVLIANAGRGVRG